MWHNPLCGQVPTCSCDYDSIYGIKILELLHDSMLSCTSPVWCLVMIRYVPCVILMNQLLWVFLFTAMEGREWIQQMTCCRTRSVPHLELLLLSKETLKCDAQLTEDMFHFQGFPGNKREEVYRQSVDWEHPNR